MVIDNVRPMNPAADRLAEMRRLVRRSGVYVAASLFCLLLSLGSLAAILILRARVCH